MSLDRFLDFLDYAGMNPSSKRMIQVGAGTLAVCLLLFLGRLRYTASIGAAVVDRCLTLKLGMTRDQVVDIMGPPAREKDGLKLDPREPSRVDLMWEVPSSFSTAPSVGMNRTSGLVESIECTEEHRLVVREYTPK